MIYFECPQCGKLNFFKIKCKECCYNRFRLSRKELKHFKIQRDLTNNLYVSITEYFEKNGVYYDGPYLLIYCLAIISFFYESYYNLNSDISKILINHYIIFLSPNKSQKKAKELRRFYKRNKKQLKDFQQQNLIYIAFEKKKSKEATVDILDFIIQNILLLTENLDCKKIRKYEVYLFEKIAKFTTIIFDEKNISKINKKRYFFGIFCIILEILGICGAIETNNLPKNLIELFGFLLPGFIGIYLMLTDYK